MEEAEQYSSQTLSPNFPVAAVLPNLAGLEALYSACRKIYPEQSNPLQVTALLKYWLGGPDPLDYISMYANAGDSAKGIPPHWHYISFGLSDLHGDGRVHEISGSDTPSGFGFELTFRLKQEPQDTAPPTWPAAVMQALAKYVFQSENTLCAGDHVSWHCPLDHSESRIQHMLMTEDTQFQTVQTPFGPVSFVQIVGVCAEELQAAQHWNGPGVIELLKKHNGAGGPWLITDMRRGETIFELDPLVQEAVDQGIELEGSNLSGVSARCSWIKKVNVKEEEMDPTICRVVENNKQTHLPEISELESEQIKLALKKGLRGSKSALPPISSGSKYPSELDDNQNMHHKEAGDSNASSDAGTLESGELVKTQMLDSVHLTFNLEAGTLLPLALRGRLRHGRHFTFKSVVGDVAVTFVPPSVTGAFANQEHPYAAHGPWLQVLLKEETIGEMLSDLEVLSKIDDVILPKTFSWPNKGLTITILPDEY